MDHAQKARDLFKQGFNCAQAVFLAFNDRMGLDEATALKLSSSFGGGMGRLREVCGAVSGMFMVIGVLYGYDDPADRGGKTEHYRTIQALAEKFRDENGSIICRELLGLGGGASAPVPEARTETYYKKRPCADMVESAARITEAYIAMREGADA